MQNHPADRAWGFMLQAFDDYLRTLPPAAREATTIVLNSHISVIGPIIDVHVNGYPTPTPTPTLPIDDPETKAEIN